MNLRGQHYDLYDKFLHLLAGAGIASLLATLLAGLGVAHAPLWGFAAAVLAGAGKEALDWLSRDHEWAARVHAWAFHEPTGDVNVWDFLCTVIAGAIAAGVMAHING